MHKNYPSHVTKEQFENIRSILENSKKKTKPRNLDLYEVFCAVLYVLKSGCQWRMLPKNFPKWQTVYYYFQIWSKNSDKEPIILTVIKNGLLPHVLVEKQWNWMKFNVILLSNRTRLFEIYSKFEGK